MVRDQTLQFLKRSFANNVSWTKASPDCRYRFEVIGVNEFRPEFKITDHSHPYYEVGLGLVGSGALLLGKETKTVKPGDLYIIEPGITHRVSALEEGTFAVFIFQVTLESKKSEQPSNSIPGIVGSSLLVESEIEKLILSWAEINVGKSQDPVSLSLFARCLAFEMLSLLSVSSKIGDWAVTDRAIKYIEESLPGKFDVSTMATDLMVSQRTLRRHFQNELGQSIIEYLSERRLVLAERYLSLHLSVTDVAGMVGFESASQLPRLFQKAKGVTPKTWQQTVAPTRRIPDAK